MKLAFVFEVFGAVIINYINQNVKMSLDNGYIMCEYCGERVLKVKNNQLYCENCAKAVQKQQIKEWKLKNKENSKIIQNGSTKPFVACMF